MASGPNDIILPGPTPTPCSSFSAPFASLLYAVMFPRQGPQDPTLGPLLVHGPNYHV